LDRPDRSVCRALRATKAIRAKEECKGSLAKLVKEERKGSVAKPGHRARLE
jgi:hypothetical protein